MLKIHETTTSTGELSPVFLSVEDGALVLVSAEGASPLPAGALDAVMTRYGAPLEPAERLVPVGALDLGDGRSVRHARHLARYDVIARDYLVYESPGCDPRCALAATVSAALGHLARVNRP